MKTSLYSIVRLTRSYHTSKKKLFAVAGRGPSQRHGSLRKFNETLLRTSEKIRHSLQKFVGRIDMHPVPRFGNAHDLSLRKDLQNF
jgi:hypothetical protein